jgi:hypothetical protein
MTVAGPTTSEPSSFQCREAPAVVAHERPLTPMLPGPPGAAATQDFGGPYPGAPSWGLSRLPEVPVVPTAPDKRPAPDMRLVRIIVEAAIADHGGDDVRVGHRGRRPPSGGDHRLRPIRVAVVGDGTRITGNPLAEPAGSSAR